MNIPLLCLLLTLNRFLLSFIKCSSLESNFFYLLSQQNTARLQITSWFLVLNGLIAHYIRGSCYSKCLPNSCSCFISLFLIYTISGSVKNVKSINEKSSDRVLNQKMRKWDFWQHPVIKNKQWNILNIYFLILSYILLTDYLKPIIS